MVRSHKKLSLLARAIEASEHPDWTRVESAHRVRRRVGERQRAALLLSVVAVLVLIGLAAVIAVTLAVLT